MKFSSATIGDVASVQTGPFGSQLHKEDYVISGTPIVTVEHLGQRKMTRLNLPCVSDADKRRLSKYTLEYGDLVFSRVGSVDRCSWVGKEETGWMFSGRCLRVRPNDPMEIYHKYLYYFFNLETTKNYVRNIAVGATMPSINTRLLSEVPITFPDIAKQQQIGDMLSTLDDRIEVNLKINHHLEQMAQAIFKSWFIDFEPFGGEMPEDWCTGSLLDIANYLNGLAMQRFRPANGEVGLLVLKIKELRQGSFDSASELCSPNIRPDYIVHDGDVVFSWSGSLLVDFWCGGDCGLNQHLFKVTSQKYEKWFYYVWTCHHLAQFIAMAADKATTMGHIKREALENAEVLIPSEKDYATIGELLSPLYERIIGNRVENRKLALLRDTLLPCLMSGELSVADLGSGK